MEIAAFLIAKACGLDEDEHHNRQGKWDKHDVDYRMHAGDAPDEGGEQIGE